jgi:hypothetical protein
MADMRAHIAGDETDALLADLSDAKSRLSAIASIATEK